MGGLGRAGVYRPLVVFETLNKLARFTSKEGKTREENIVDKLFSHNHNSQFTRPEERPQSQSKSKRQEAPNIFEFLTASKIITNPKINSALSSVLPVVQV